MFFLILLPYALGFRGKATFYNNPNQDPGSCGFGFSDTEFIAALSDDMMVGYKSPNCNRMVKVEYKGKSIVAKLVDTCPTCERTSLDLSAAAFKALEDPDVGLIDIQWDFIDGDQSHHGNVQGSPAVNHAPQATPPVQQPAQTDSENKIESKSQNESSIDPHVLQGKAAWMKNPNNAVGSCRVSYSETDLVVAVSTTYGLSVCNQMLKVDVGEKSLTLKIVDTCEKCDKNFIVLSTGAFKTFADLNIGIIDVKWRLLTPLNSGGNQTAHHGTNQTENHGHGSHENHDNHGSHNNHGNAPQSTEGSGSSSNAPKQLYTYGMNKTQSLDESGVTLPSFIALIFLTLFINAL